MMRNKGYICIDFLNILFVIGIIFVNILSVFLENGSGDVLLFREISIIAYAFFCTALGFFGISNYSYNNEKLKEFIKRISLIYLFAIIINLPLNIYKGYFVSDFSFESLIKDIIFSGTVYNLWVFPCIIIGFMVAWFLVRKFGFKRAFFISLLLYAFEMLGGSYFFLVQKVLPLKYIYTNLHQISDSIGNGIFFAPVFFIIGGMICNNKKKISLKKDLNKRGILFIVSFFLLMLEIGTLKRLDLTYYNKGYIFLLPTSYLLLSLASAFKGKYNKNIRPLSIFSYIVYPSAVTIVRLLSESLKFFDNILIDFLSVFIITMTISSILVLILNVIKKKFQKKEIHSKDRAWAEVNLNNLKYNIMQIRNAIDKKCEIMAVVKANGYGHGAYEIATNAEKMGVNAFAVATIDEGIELRKCGISGEILILGYTDISRAKELRKYNLTQTLIDYDYSIALNNKGVKIKAHIKIDTGMHRLGFDKNDIGKIAEVFSMENIYVRGIYTHLCTADSLNESDIEFTNKQILSFYSVIDRLKGLGIPIPKTHIQGTYGLLNYNEINADYVRIGDGLYGILSSNNRQTRLTLDLKPVFSLKSRVILIRDIKAGDIFGYGRAFKAMRDTKIAIASIGFGDGIVRNLSDGVGYVLINGKRASIVGKICMDQLAIDITDIENVKVGDVITLIGNDTNESIWAEDIGMLSDTIASEVLVRKGNRVCNVRK